MVLKMIERQISLDIISDVTGLSISKLERLANEKIQKIQSQQK
jgi:DNA-binding Xre family transcriptional regulator